MGVKAVSLFLLPIRKVWVPPPWVPTSYRAVRQRPFSLFVVVLPCSPQGSAHYAEIESPEVENRIPHLYMLFGFEVALDGRA